VSCAPQRRFHRFDAWGSVSVIICQQNFQSSRLLQCSVRSEQDPEDGHDER
jgi:hypothetical protein